MTTFMDVQLWVERILWIFAGADEFTWMLGTRRLAKFATLQTKESA